VWPLEELWLQHDAASTSLPAHRLGEAEKNPPGQEEGDRQPILSYGREETWMRHHVEAKALPKATRRP
jgi:hypothetical protein